MATTTPLGFRIPSADGTDQMSELEEWFRNLGTDVDTYLRAQISPLQSYSPTLGNVSIGTGGSPLSDFRWANSGGIVTVIGRIILGTTGSVTGQIQVSTPVTMAGWSNQAILGSAAFRDVSAPATILGEAQYATSTVVTLNVRGVTGSLITLNNASATVPFTWAAGDYITCFFSFIPA